jgi:hypothetical protein
MAGQVLLLLLRRPVVADRLLLSRAAVSQKQQSKSEVFMRAYKTGSICCAILLCIGCRATQIRHDHQEIRDALIRLNQQQVLNNVARAYLRYPLMHIDYGTITGDVTTTTDTSVSGGKDDTDNAFGGPVSAANAIGNVKTTYALSGKLTNVAKLSLAGNPATARAVYEAYFQYVKDARSAENPGDVHPVTPSTSPFAQ